MSLANVTLELSLKPFRDDDFEPVCRTLFRQWLPLVERAEQVSVMLWVADGSELLDYRGDLDGEFEWARYIGGANPRATIANDPDGVCLHSRCYDYMTDPPRRTYRDLAAIVATLKRVGREVTGLPVRVGETFDPGPEFAKSSFKYERHEEICLAGTMGRASFVCCYARLNADDVAYAGFPDGIPQDTPLGTFLGRQAQHFLTDLGFDYLWLSNGFGFGLETWATTGALFDGTRFAPELVPEVGARQLEFWRLFRAECPNFPLETRGTNLSTGIDLASDGVPLADIYRGGFDLQPPPNSPWAALNGDFGFELVGYLSHIAELPGEAYPFRFYVHDPWWLNSPWLDRYGREPHDIYLPLSVARAEAGGGLTPLGSVSILTADDSLGNLPDQCPREVIPHLLAALDHAPDEPGPLVWVYPFDEYHALTFGEQPRLAEVFSGDWLMRAAINDGLPVNSVVSSANYLAEPTAAAWDERVLLSLVPDAGTPLSEALLARAAAGGALLLYGPTQHADPRWHALLGLTLAEPVEGEVTVRPAGELDDAPAGVLTLHHRALLGGGPLAEASAGEADWRVLLDTSAGERVAAVQRGALAWVRGADSQGYSPGAHLLSTLPASRSYSGAKLLRLALARLGWHVSFAQPEVDSRHPLTCFARHRGGWWLSGYTPDTTVALRLRTPLGAPLLVGAEALLGDGLASYHLPRAWHRECRVFVEQASGVGSCVEQHSGELGVTRRLLVSGLRDATLRFCPEPGSEVTMLAQPRYPYLVGEFLTPAREGACLVVRGVSGHVLVSW